MAKRTLRENAIRKYYRKRRARLDGRQARLFPAHDLLLAVREGSMPQGGKVLASGGTDNAPGLVPVPTVPPAQDE